MSPSDVITYIRQHPKELTDALVREHRTHQQSTISSIYQILRVYAQICTEYGTDLRNEAAATWAQKVTKQAYFFPYL